MSYVYLCIAQLLYERCCSLMDECINKFTTAQKDNHKLKAFGMLYVFHLCLRKQLLVAVLNSFVC